MLVIDLIYSAICVKSFTAKTERLSTVPTVASVLRSWIITAHGAANVLAVEI
jgi:hypothetical protein